MHVAGRADAGFGHGCLHRRRGFANLRAAADFLGQEIAGERDADREPLLFGRRAAVRGMPGEHGDMGRKHALGAAGHHERHAPFHLCRRQIQVSAEQAGESGGGVFTRVVIDAAVTLGLAHNRDNCSGIQPARFDQRGEPGHIAGTASCDAHHFYCLHDLRLPCFVA